MSGSIPIPAPIRVYLAKKKEEKIEVAKWVIPKKRHLKAKKCVLTVKIIVFPLKEFGVVKLCIEKGTLGEIKISKRFKNCFLRIQCSFVNE